MQCPFPGMDPYIERPDIWPDFHGAFVAEIRGVLQPLLRPKYAALMQDRLYVVESQRPIYPDLAVVKPLSSPGHGNGGVAVLEVDEPILFETSEEEIRQPYIEIVEATGGHRLITAIEVLSPDNKAAGAGRDKYLQKCREVRQAGAGLVEIDLLRAGKSVLRLSPEGFGSIPAWHYLVGVMRPPKQQAVYPIALQKRLATIKVPLTGDDPDIFLDLQAAFTLAWQKGPYPALLNYDVSPPGPLTVEEIAWCEGLLTQAGLRDAKNP